MNNLADLNQRMDERIAILSQELADRQVREAPPTSILLIEENQVLREEIDALRDCLQKYVSSCGHTHNCPVVCRNAKECGPLCIEVRGLLGIKAPRNPYSEK